MRSIHPELQKLWPFQQSLCTQQRGSGFLSWLMIHRGALWLNLCNYTLSVSRARPIILCQPFLSLPHNHTCATFFGGGSWLFFPPLLLFLFSLWSTACFYPSVCLCFFFLFSLSSLPLSLSHSPSFPPFLPHPLCLLQINYALIYAQLPSQGTVLHIYHPLNNGAASFSAQCSPHGWCSSLRESTLTICLSNSGLWTENFDMFLFLFTWMPTKQTETHVCCSPKKDFTGGGQLSYYRGYLG